MKGKLQGLHYSLQGHLRYNIARGYTYSTWKGTALPYGHKCILATTLRARTMPRKINRNRTASNNSIKRRPGSRCSCPNTLANFHSPTFYLRFQFENAYLGSYFFNLNDCWLSCSSVLPHTLTADQIEQSFNVRQKQLHSTVRQTGNVSGRFN